MKNMKKVKSEKKSKRLEFAKSDIKNIDQAANIKGQSAKKFMEISVLAATLQTLINHGKQHPNT